MKIRALIKPIFVLPILFAGTFAFAQSAGTFTATGNMTTARSSHTATLLANGKVLIAGGAGSVNPLATAELYDPVNGTFTRTGDMTAPRFGHTATLLPDGRVLIAGGSDVPQASIPMNTAEIYDPSTGAFAATSNMVSGHVCQQANLLGNGKVLIVGGSGANGRVPSPELYDPATGAFAAAGTYASNISGFNTCQGGVSTLLPDGKVLIVWEGDHAEIFDPDAGLFTATTNPSSTQYFADGLPTATLLLNGTVLVAGGADDWGIYASAETYDPLTGTFTATGNMTIGRNGQTATLLPDGSVLMAGAYLFGGTALASTESYHPVSAGFTPTGDMTTARQGHTATLLNDGRVLIAGGSIMPFSSTATAELYNSDVLVSAPALFSLSGDGNGQGAIWHAATGQVATAGLPAAAGEALSMYTTGLGDGSMIPPQVAVSGQLAKVLYFGGAPAYPGYNQVNFTLPNGVTPGPAIPVRLTYLGRPSNEVTIGVR